MNTLIKNAMVLFSDGTVKESDIAVAGDIIQEVGVISQEFHADTVIDAKNKLALPGFINAHTHASMTLLRNYADDMNLMDWLTKEIWPIEAKMQEDDIYWGAMLAAVEMIKSGTTAFVDMYGPNMEKVADAVDVSGMRAVLSRGIIGVADGDKKLEENISLYHDYHNACDGRITVMFGPHALYTCSPDFLKKVAKEAEKVGAEIHIHMSETMGEVENCLKDYGKRPFAHVESTGLFELGTLAAHCVWLDDEDIEIIKRHDVRIAHNPGSNMKLASGVAPVQRLLDEGVCVALGTDGASSNNNLDMLQEIQLAALLGKVHTLDPLNVSAWSAVQMGTMNGAKAVGISDIGRIEAGCKADIILMSMQGADWYPRHNLIAHLAYGANSSAVDTVMVNGKLLMEKRRLLTLDEERICYEAERVAKNLAAK